MQDARLFAHFVRINGPPADPPAQHRRALQRRARRPLAPCHPPHPRNARIGPLRMAGSQWGLRSQPGLALLPLIDCGCTCHSLVPGSHSLVRLTQQRNLDLLAIPSWVMPRRPCVPCRRQHGPSHSPSRSHLITVGRLTPSARAIWLWLASGCSAA